MSSYSREEIQRRSDIITETACFLAEQKDSDNFPQILKNQYLRTKDKLRQTDYIFSHIENFDILNDYAQRLKESLAIIQTNIDFMENVFLGSDTPSNTVVDLAYALVAETEGHAEILYERACVLRGAVTLASAVALKKFSGLERKLAS